jgi:NAD(P)-dependent dehydrogenase (short-subunit alcohol dehydrogenase family)
VIALDSDAQTLRWTAERTAIGELLEVITANIALAVAGSATAIRRLLSEGPEGAIVNVSSHQAQRPVPGALPRPRGRDWL